MKQFGKQGLGWMAFLFGIALALAGCQKAVQKQPSAPAISSPVGQLRVVTVARENVREKPNGKIIGRVHRGDSLRILARKANWLQFRSKKFKNAYLWAPSAGFEYLNLYSPYFYYDTTARAFRPVAYFQAIFSDSGTIQQETSKEYELFFGDVGLGEHEEMVMEVVTTTTETVRHGITLFVSKPDQKITRVKVDFFKPVNGYAAALQKCGLPVVKPSLENSGHLIWKPGTLVADLTVDLERKEWESSTISSVWYYK
ncbi:MAG: hypothetical protein D6715_07795 [Calditrichaeota bacterium]|nr:MAG: hypothetical protein D6715_07795 [Calditrichota bacterium]